MVFPLNQLPRQIVWFVFCLFFLNLKGIYELTIKVLSIFFNELGQIEALMLNPFIF